MKIVQKIFGMILIILLAILFASIFGALHNQLSYSVSNEFFEEYLFGNFGVNEWGIQNERLKASIIGVLGSYWVGLYLGILYAIIYVFLKTNQNLKNILSAISLNLMVAFIGSIVGYILAHFFIPQENTGVFIDFGIQRPQNYIEAAYMNTGSYYAGFFGLVIGIIYLAMKNQK